MNKNPKPITILMADDDAEDRQLTKEAFEENCLSNDLRFVENGEEMLDYLNRRGKFSDPKTSPRPGLILLDLNMPRMDGREALREMKARTTIVAMYGNIDRYCEGMSTPMPWAWNWARVTPPKR